MNRSTTIRTVKLFVLGLSVLALSAHGGSKSANAPANAPESAIAKQTAEAQSQDSSQDSPNAPIDLAELTMTVYKSPTCGCCKAWVRYMQTEGFSVTAVDTDDVDSIKAKLGLTSPELKSCHTAVVDGYVIEGHVPAKDVSRLLTERPDIIGLTAPGMPMMSPGMGSLIPKDYDVLAIDKDGRARVWSSY
ncbi:MAG: DUF411 domain-containing protein [Granulosicoccus sp.]|nr:DUF411 domain-containing protein [Granulosicoccus sp.]